MLPNRKVQELAQRLGFKTAELAAILGVEPSTVRNYRRNSNPPQIPTALVLKFIEVIRDHDLHLALEWFYNEDPLPDLTQEARATYNGLDPNEFAALMAIRAAANSLPRLLTADVLNQCPQIKRAIDPILRDMADAVRFYQEFARSSREPSLRAEAIKSVQESIEFCRDLVAT